MSKPNTSFSFRKTASTSISVGTLLFAAAPLLAADGQLALEEVVVTAQKKEENLQDIGSTVNALQGDALEEYSLTQFSDLEELTSGLTLDINNPRIQTVSLRGISYDQDSGTSPAVDAYWNGVNVSSNVAFSAMYDMERIEVLRGPQGALQGITSPAGSISFITRQAQPSETEGYVLLSASDAGLRQTKFGWSLPLNSDTFAVRLAGFYDENELEGIKNITTGNTQDGSGRGGRLSMKWEPTDSFGAELVIQNDEATLDGDEDIYGSDAIGSIPGISPGVKPDLGVYSRKTLAEGDNQYEKRNQVSALTLNWDIGEHLLTSISGYQETDQRDHRDLDYANAVEGQSQNEWVESEYKVVSQELRLSASPTENWEYMVGMFYRDSKTYTYFERDLFPNNHASSTVSSIPLDTTNYSLYTFNTLHLADNFRLQAGLRWQKFKAFKKTSVLVGENDGTFGPLLPGTLLLELITKDEQESEENAVTGSLKAIYDYNDDLMVYASYDRGFRSGGISIAVEVSQPDLLTYDSENSNSLEMGFKAVLGDGRYIVNGAMYYQQFDGFLGRATDFPVDDNFDGVADSKNLQGLNFNADATIRGVEMEFTAMASENWIVNGGISYNDSKYDSGETGPCTDLSQLDGTQAIALCDIGGVRIGGEPNWSVNLMSDYTIPLSATDAYVRANFKFTGARSNEQLVGGDVGGYSVTGLYAGLRDKEQSWDINLWVKNLFDKEAQRGTFAQEGSILGSTGYARAKLIQERTVGVTGRYNF